MVLGQVRDDEVAPVPPPARPQRPVAIVGGGSIGVGWAVVFARGQQQVNVFEPAPRRRQLFPGELRRRLEALADSGLIEEDVSAVADRVSVSADLPEAVGPSCYVQECSPEDADVKRSVFESLDRYSSSDAVLASSSSALPASEIATGLSCAPRCLIAHPGNPPYLLPVVELVPAPFTDPAVVERADAFLRSVGMIPARLGRELEGFVFNRLQGAVLREAYCLVRDGIAKPEDIDIVMREGLGRRWSVLGPFEVAELNTRGRHRRPRAGDGPGLRPDGCGTRAIRPVDRRPGGHRLRRGPETLPAGTLGGTRGMARPGSHGHGGVPTGEAHRERPTVPRDTSPTV